MRRKSSIEVSESREGLEIRMCDLNSEVAGVASHRLTRKEAVALLRSLVRFLFG